MLSAREEALRRAAAPAPTPGSHAAIAAVAEEADPSEEEPTPEAPAPATVAATPVAAPQPPVIHKQVLVVHPVADIMLSALEVLLTDTVITLILPASAKASFAPKFETKFQIVFDGQTYDVMAITASAQASVFPCSIISFLRYKVDDQNSQT